MSARAADPEKAVITIKAIATATNLIMRLISATSLSTTTAGLQASLQVLLAGTLAAGKMQQANVRVATGKSVSLPLFTELPRR